MRALARVRKSAIRPTSSGVSLSDVHREVAAPDVENGMFLSAMVKELTGISTVRAAALVAASGGFEANVERLKEGWGEIAGNFSFAARRITAAPCCGC
jgi:hypothetical protein